MRCLSGLVVLLSVVGLLVFLLCVWPAVGEAAALGPKEAARVGKDVIPMSQFRSVYRGLIGRVPPAMWSGLRRRVLRSLIDATLLAQGAKKAGLSLAPNEVQRWIEKNPMFQKHGRFSRTRFHLRLRTMLHLSAKTYRKRLKVELLARKMRRRLVAKVRAPQERVNEEIFREHTRLRLEALVLDPASLLSRFPPSPKAVQQFQQKQKPRLQRYYQQHISRYQRPKQVRARHLLLRLSSTAPPRQVRQVRQKIMKLLAQARKPGVSFADLARQHSQGPTATRGGDLGYFGRGRMVPSFERLAFRLRPGEIGGPVRTRFGFHLIQVVARRPARRLSFSQAAPSIARRLLAWQAARQHLKPLLSRLLRQARQHPQRSLKALLPRVSSRPASSPSSSLPPIRYRLSNLFYPAKGDYLPGLGRGENLLPLLQQASAAQPVLPRFVQLSGKLYLLRLVEKHPPSPEETKALRQQLQKRLSRKQRRAALQRWLQKARQHTKITINPLTQQISP